MSVQLFKIVLFDSFASPRRTSSDPVRALACLVGFGLQLPTALDLRPTLLTPWLPGSLSPARQPQAAGPRIFFPNPGTHSLTLPAGRCFGTLTSSLFTLSLDGGQIDIRRLGNHLN